MVSEGEADARLDVVITKFKLQPVRYDRDRRTTSSEMRMIITTDVKLTRVSDGEVIVNRKGVRGDDDFERIGSLSVAKEEALPGASRDLAHEIVTAVVEFW